MDSEATRALQGIRVLDLADDTFGLCGRLLADLGASVTRAGHPENNSSRPPILPLPCDLNKQTVVVDRDSGKKSFPFGELLQEADVLIENGHEKNPESPVLKREKRERLHPRLVHLFISPFGRIGPKKHYQSSATVSSAAGGEMFVCRDAGNRPTALYGAQPYLLASLSGSVAVLLHLLKRRITIKGGFIDLSIQEAVASALHHAPVERSVGSSGIKDGGRPFFPDSDFPALPCSDGYIQLAFTGNWQTLAEILSAETGLPELLQKPWRDPAYRTAHSAQLAEMLKHWTRKRTRQTLFELGQALAFPWAPVYHPREVFESPQLGFRDFFIKAAAKSGASEIVFPGSPYKFFFNSACPSPISPPDSGKKGPISGSNVSVRYSSMPRLREPDSFDCPSGEVLKGIRVLDLTRMLSGPYCTRTLADFGAEVLKIQTRKGSTGAEQNDTPYFAAWNRNKRSITLDLDTGEARELFLELVSASDIVVENYSPRVMANWGLQYDRLKETHPAVIMLSLSAMGQTGPWKNYVGFAPTFHALSGLLAASSGTPEKGHTRIGFALADIVAGLYGTLSILAAVQTRNRTGRGCHIDLSCYESLCTFLGPAPARNKEDGLHDDIGSPEDRSIGVSPDACYPCEGEDRWCALTIDNEAAWKRFRRIVADPELYSEMFCSNAARMQNREELNERIGHWTSLRTAESVERILQEAGIAACAVQSAEDLMRDTQLEARGFFVPLPHPALGQTTADRSALWPCREARRNWRPAPAMGEANHDIFVKLLGMPEAGFREYVRRGIIG